MIQKYSLLRKYYKRDYFCQNQGLCCQICRQGVWKPFGLASILILGNLVLEWGCNAHVWSHSAVHETNFLVPWGLLSIYTPIYSFGDLGAILVAYQQKKLCDK